jgi:hypothetical protein
LNGQVFKWHVTVSKKFRQLLHMCVKQEFAQDFVIVRICNLKVNWFCFTLFYIGIIFFA